jgi:hypothetical protein
MGANVVTKPVTKPISIATPYVTSAGRTTARDRDASFAPTYLGSRALMFHQPNTRSAEPKRLSNCVVSSRRLPTA